MERKTMMSDGCTLKDQKEPALLNEMFKKNFVPYAVSERDLHHCSLCPFHPQSEVLPKLMPHSIATRLSLILMLDNLPSIMDCTDTDILNVALILMGVCHIQECLLSVICPFGIAKPVCLCYDAGHLDKNRR